MQVVEGVEVPFDITFVCTKSGSTEQVAAMLPVGGVVVTVQNGVDNHEVLRRHGHHAVPVVVRSGCRRIGPTTVVHTSSGHLVSADDQLVAMLKRWGVVCRKVDDIDAALWQKLLGNVAGNTLCAILRRPVGEIAASPELEPLIRAALAEVTAIAHAEGIRLPSSVIDDELSAMRTIPRANVPSTLQDLLSGRELERDALTGAIVRKAEGHRIAVPTVAALDALLAAAATMRQPLTSGALVDGSALPSATDSISSPMSLRNER